MRNWNTTILFTELLACFVFTVPMRNWNSTLPEIHRTDHFCFYSTYEELKRTWRCDYNWNTWSFYSTYEELKHHQWSSGITTRKAFLQYLWGIETGYFGTSNCTCYLVFTVPMRNWNYVMLPLLLVIEWVFTVPMRNWNYLAHSFKNSKLPCFYSTYEELKQNKYVDNVFVRLRFYSTYEELKQGV